MSKSEAEFRRLLNDFNEEPLMMLLIMVMVRTVL